jgi:type IV secretion system protein VirD4
MKKLMLYLYIIPFCFILAILFNSFLNNNYTTSFDTALIFNSNTYKYALLFLGVALMIILNKQYKNFGKISGKSLLESKERDEQVLAGLEQSHFQTKEELQENFTQYEFKRLKKLDIHGLPIKAEYQNKKLNVVFSKPAHSLIIGTTGSGKTTSFVNPTIQILSELKSKPSMLISDPKGELYKLHSKTLINKGYEVKVLDLRNPYKSVKWNPLERPFDNYQRMNNIEKEIMFDDKKSKWFFNGKEYGDKAKLNMAVQITKQELNDNVYEDLNDIISVLCPIKNKSEPIWESGAKNFILAIALAMLEDSKDIRLGMTKEKFNFYNIMKIATKTDNECKLLKDYFFGRDVISKAVSLSKQVLDASDKTRGSYLSTVFDKLSIFADSSICSLTSKNEIDFGSIATKPTAFFLQIPDEKETRHILASMVILQAYKELVAKANEYEDLSLPRSVHFILDEFGNLPAIYKLEQMITVGRSRKIWLSLVVQSYSQLEKIYDNKSADIIRSNCNIQMFIGTTDLKTINDFSRLCGNYSIISKNINFGKQGDTSTSESVKERPLIYPSELQQLNSHKNMGNIIINVFGFPPIKSKFTPSFKCPVYKFEEAKKEEIIGEYFDEEKLYYNIIDRNKIKLKKIKDRLLKAKVKGVLKEFMDLSFDFIGQDKKDTFKDLITKEDFNQAKGFVNDIITKNKKGVSELFIKKLKEIKQKLEDLQ